jgi:DNA-binding transcriptional MerR regulator
MLKIGEFSKLSRVSVKALRHYDEIGLLRPVQVDPSTGYRFYGHEQLPRLDRILALRDLGFSLEQIGQMLEEGFPRISSAGCTACVAPIWSRSWTKDGSVWRASRPG